MTAVWKDGQLVAEHEAVGSLLSDAALRGISVFEGVAAYWWPEANQHCVISLDFHLRRLMQSAAFMEIARPEIVSDVTEAITTLLPAMAGADVYVRPTVYLERGYYEGGDAVSSLFVSARPLDAVPRPESLTCHVSSFRHFSPDMYPSLAKTGATYAFFRLSRLEASRHGADEAILLTTTGRVAETPGASIFVVSDGVVRTPPIDVGILDSITRRTSIDLLRGMGVDVEETEFGLDELLASDEVFVTGTMDEIRPVSSINGVDFSIDSSGIGSKLRREYLLRCHGTSGTLLPGSLLVGARS